MLLGDLMAGGGRRRKVTPTMIEEMRWFRKEGLSYQEIAKRLDVAPMTVYNYLKKKERVGFFKRLNRKIVPIAIVIVVVSVAFVGYYLLTRGGPKEVEFKIYTNENYSFKFDYPDNWNFSAYYLGLPQPVVAKFFANPAEDAIISLTIFDKNSYENHFGVSLDNLASYVSSQENRFENLGMLISKPTEIVIDNHFGVRLSATAAIENTSFRGQLELVVKDNYLYEFTMASSEENYPTYKPIFDHVINSFSFLG